MRRAALLLLCLPAEALAAGLFPGPNDPGHDANLAALAAAYDRQFHVFNAAPFGVSLDAFVPIASDRTLIADFLAQSAMNDFAIFANGRTVEDTIPIRGEYGDLGMFGGVGAVAEAARYAALRDEGAPAALVDAARADLLDAIAAFQILSQNGAPRLRSHLIPRSTTRNLRSWTESSRGFVST